MMKVILLYGPPRCGKSTLIQRLRRANPHLSIMPREEHALLRFLYPEDNDLRRMLTTGTTITNQVMDGQRVSVHERHPYDAIVFEMRKKPTADFLVRLETHCEDLGCEIILFPVEGGEREADDLSSLILA